MSTDIKTSSTKSAAETSAALGAQSAASEPSVELPPDFEATLSMCRDKLNEAHLNGSVVRYDIGALANERKAENWGDAVVERFARELGISARTLYRWVRVSDIGQVSHPR